MANQEYLSASQVARRIGAYPQDVTNLVHRDHAINSQCAIFAGRRAIPESLVPAIEAELRRRGRLPSTSTTENQSMNEAEANKAKADFDRAVQAAMAHGLTRHAAIRAVANRQPELHARYIAATNPKYGQLRTRVEDFR